MAASPATLRLTPRQAAVLEYVRSCGRASTAQVTNAFNLTTTPALRCLEALADRGLLDRFRDKRPGYYTSIWYPKEAPSGN